MQHTIQHAPAFSTLEIQFQAGETLATQPGAMIAMTPGFEVLSGMGTQMKGGAGVTKAVRSFFAGENFFTAIYKAKRDGEQLILGAAHPGDIRSLPVVEGDPTPWLLANGAFLACSSTVTLELKYEGVRGFMATRGFFLMRPMGTGEVFVACHGALVERTLGEGERFVLDNRHLIAVTEGMKRELVKVTSSVRHSIFSGEGVVNRYTGPGKVLYQTRAFQSQGFFRNMLGFAT